MIRRSTLSLTTYAAFLIALAACAQTPEAVPVDATGSEPSSAMDATMQDPAMAESPAPAPPTPAPAPPVAPPPTPAPTPPTTTTPAPAAEAQVVIDLTGIRSRLAAETGLAAATIPNSIRAPASVAARLCQGSPTPPADAATGDATCKAVRTDAEFNTALKNTVG